MYPVKAGEAEENSYTQMYFHSYLSFPVLSHFSFSGDRGLDLVVWENLF